jgi:hypothetical protein
MWGFPLAKARRVNAGWVYNWRPYPGPLGELGRITEYVPMIYSSHEICDRVLDDLSYRGYHSLLTFNEPDNAAQANMAVDEALYFWPKLMKTGLRLGAPAMKENYAWLVEFMDRAQALGYRIDFITAHCYPDLADADLAASNVIELCRRLHRRFRRPVWVTEISGINPPSFAHLKSFMETVCKRLNSLPWIERYAWFSDYPIFGFESIFNGNGKLTSAGKIYRQLILGEL